MFLYWKITLVNHFLLTIFCLQIEYFTADKMDYFIKTETDTRKTI